MNYSFQKNPPHLPDILLHSRTIRIKKGKWIETVLPDHIYVGWLGRADRAGGVLRCHLFKGFDSQLKVHGSSPPLHV